MDHRPPRPADSAVPAHWLTDRVDLWGPHWVTNLVGAGFPAYARLLHPLGDHSGAPTWAAVAAVNGRTMHPSVQWAQISSPTRLRDDNAQKGHSQPGEPCDGELTTWALEALCAILAGHTATLQACYFAVWEGYGGLDVGPGSFTTAYRVASDGVVPEFQLPGPAPAEWQLDLTGPTFAVPGRNNYYLFEGHISQALRIGHWVHERWFLSQSPNWLWPADHSWCVGMDVDDDSTVIGGSPELVAELCASETLEVFQIAPDAPFEDRINH